MPLTELPFNLPGKIFRSPMPFAYFDPENDTFDLYTSQNVTNVVMLVSDDEALKHSGLNLRDFYHQAGLDVIHYPISDFSAPNDHEEFYKTVENVVQLTKSGANVAVHCFAGIGRAGMFIALMARIILSLEGDEAIKWVRQYVPDAIQTPEQRSIVNQYTIDPS